VRFPEHRVDPALHLDLLPGLELAAELRWELHLEHSAEPVQRLEQPAAVESDAVFNFGQISNHLQIPACNRQSIADSALVFELDFEHFHDSEPDFGAYSAAVIAFEQVLVQEQVPDPE